MSKISVLVLGAAILSGCATKEMKSTLFYEGDQVTYVGEASDRVNLWPVAYWRNPVGSVLWPLTSFSDDHFAFRPIYSQYKQGGRDGVWDEYNFLWPIVQVDAKNNDYRVFPVFWGWDGDEDFYQAVFPLYWNGHDYNALFPLWYHGSHANRWTFHTLGGLAGARRTDTGYRSSWTFPLWYEDNTGLFTTILYGQTKDSHWVFPFWYKGEKAFVSPLYAQGVDSGKGWWAAPAALSWGSWRQGEKDTRSEGTVLLGLGHWYSSRNKEGLGYCSWHVFPFVARTVNEKNKYGGVRKTRRETNAACYLFGRTTLEDKMTSCYVFPFFGWSEDGDWWTPLCGQICTGSSWNGDVDSVTNTFVTPFVGVKSGAATGGWVFPFWWHEKDTDFEDKRALIDAPSLPDCMTVSVVTNDMKWSDYFGQSRLQAPSFGSSDETVVLLHDADHQIRGRNDFWRDNTTNNYEICERRKRGNKLLMNYEFERTVIFDLGTKEKKSDQEESEASFLVWLYQYESNRDRMKDDEYARHRVLWRLWDWEEKDGDVALDVFPGFTYDRRTDGYTKTSFLWRLFRNEYDPKEGRKVDLLFVPVWR